MRRIRIKLRLFATLRDKYGINETTVECNGTLEDLLKVVEEKFGGEFIKEFFDKREGRIREDRLIFLNGIHMKSFSKIELKDGDVISIFPPVGGG
ncbi:MAG: MoaD/ThiS family protein [Candidatus Asgardarchaeia archaeon]